MLANDLPQNLPPPTLHAFRELPDGSALLYFGDKVYLARAPNGNLSLEAAMPEGLFDDSKLYDAPEHNVSVDQPDFWELPDLGQRLGPYLFFVLDGHLRVEHLDESHLGHIYESITERGFAPMVHSEKGWYTYERLNNGIQFRKIYGPTSPIEQYIKQYVWRQTDSGLFFSTINYSTQGRALYYVTNTPQLSIQEINLSSVGNVKSINFSVETGPIIETSTGWFRVYIEAGISKLQPFTHLEHTGSLHYFQAIPGAGALLQNGMGLYWAHVDANQGILARLDDHTVGKWNGMTYIPNIGVLVQAEKDTALAHLVRGRVVVDPMPYAHGTFLDAYQKDSPLVKFFAEQFYLLEQDGDLVRSTPLGSDLTGKVSDVLEIARGREFMIASEHGLFVASKAENKLRYTRIDARPPAAEHALMLTTKGIVYERASTGIVAAWRDEGGWRVTKQLDTADYGIEANSGLDLGEGVMLFPVTGQHENSKNLGLLTLMLVDDRVIAQQVIGSDDLLFDRNVMLVKAIGKGWLIPWRLNRFAGHLNEDLTMWLSSQSPEFATVKLLNQALIESSEASALDRNLDFEVGHECSEVFAKASVVADVRDSDGNIAKVKRVDILPATGPGKAAISVRVALDRATDWNIQLKLARTGENIGPPQKVVIPSSRSGFAELLGLVLRSGEFLAGVLLAWNILLFVLARRSAKAWRMASDLPVSKFVFRWLTFCFAYFVGAQLWILDLYFQGRRRNVGELRPFLDVPCRQSDEILLPASIALKRPWGGRHIWIQGESGMGKTAVFQHSVHSQLREEASSFSAYANWGGVVVAFNARDISDGTEDADDPKWVFEGLTSAMAQYGLTFETDLLLRKMLQAGTIIVAIDGLNEAARPLAVKAFVTKYPQVAILVTSQDLPRGKWQVIRLPSDMREYARGLLTVFLGLSQGKMVADAITASGLLETIRSGYDIRLIADLAMLHPAGEGIPTNQIELYNEAIRHSWPNLGPDRVSKECDLLSAAAWVAVSNHSPSEKGNRLRANGNLELLESLSDVAENSKRSVRILRRAGNDFEFVHDEMHAFLAARWLAQEGNGSNQILKMIETSSLWMQSSSTQKALWGFVAALLDGDRIMSLWQLVEDKENLDALRRKLRAEAKRRKLVDLPNAEEP